MSSTVTPAIALKSLQAMSQARQAGPQGLADGEDFVETLAAQSGYGSQGREQEQRELGSGDFRHGQEVFKYSVECWSAVVDCERPGEHLKTLEGTVLGA